MKHVAHLIENDLRTTRSGLPQWEVAVNIAERVKLVELLKKHADFQARHPEP